MTIKKALNRCLISTESSKGLSVIINYCHKLALSYLRIRASSSKLYRIHNENLSDLAWDFIADIFEKDSNNQFKLLSDYFKDLDLAQMSEVEIKIELRKIVFTKVDDNIFRNLGELDPSLKKIIRNLKLAIRDKYDDSEVSYVNGKVRFGNEINCGLPVMPQDFLQMKLGSRIREGMQIPDILEEINSVFSEQNSYKKSYPLSLIAIVIRDIYVHFNSSIVKSVNNPKAELHLLNGEMEEFLDRSIMQINNTIGLKYVRSKKIEPELLEAYLRAAKRIISDHFSEVHEGQSQYEYLREELDLIDYSSFRKQHRQVLEYLVKSIRTELIENYRREWS